MAQVKVLVGTKKGAFIYSSDEQRETWEISDPIYTGWSVFNMAADTRDTTPRIYAAANHWAWGPSIARSKDLGKTWDYRSPGLGFPKEAGESVQNTWYVTPGPPSQPGVVYAGTQPAGLFRSEDWGETWASVDTLNLHPDRAKWSGTGGGNSCLHSIQFDPDTGRMYLSISASASFYTDDDGKTWQPFATRLLVTNEMGAEFNKAAFEAFRDQFPDDLDPLAATEVHAMRIDVKNPQRLWTQTHVGVFRSDDRGQTWTDVTEGLPSFHGFPIAVSRKDPDAVFVFPLAFSGLYDNFRVADGQMAVWRTQDAGKTWQGLTKGLPGPHDYQSVYREGLATDGLDAEGVYVGTSNGEVYASTDGGDSWRRLPGTLPPILSVTTAVI